MYYFDFIEGFSFYDKDGVLLYKIGYTNDEGESSDEEIMLETFQIAENERIVGVKAKHTSQNFC